MSGINRIIAADMATPITPKGSALRSALGSAYSPSAITGTKVEKQTIKMPSKK